MPSRRLAHAQQSRHSDGVTHSMPTFIPPCIPTRAKALPAGPGWLHEPKLDGWRIQVVKEDDRIALLTRNGHDLAQRLPRLTKALQDIHLRSCIIDGELVADEEDRIGSALTMQSALASGREGQVAVMAFDLLHMAGEDLREVPLIQRKECLEALVGRATLPGLSYVAAFEDGGPLLATMESLCLEGVVSKRYDAPYRSGRRKEWVKVKCQIWLEANRERWRVFR